MPCRSAPVVLPAAPSAVITVQFWTGPSLPSCVEKFWPARRSMRPLNPPTGFRPKPYVALLPQLPAPWPYFRNTLPSVPMAMIGALMPMLPCASSVSVVLAAQLTASFTTMPPPLPPAPALLWICTEPPARPADRVAPVMSPPLAATTKSVGSISQVPWLPLAASVVIAASGRTVTWLALVSTKPPLPPCGALASSVPATFT